MKKKIKDKKIKINSHFNENGPTLQEIIEKGLIDYYNDYLLKCSKKNNTPK